MVDLTLSCRDCGQSFLFSAGEQEFFAQKGFSHPSRCPDCRHLRRQQRNGGESTVTQPGESERQFYEVICAECGKVASVPFKPRGHRPTYCRDCYATRR